MHDFSPGGIADGEFRTDVVNPYEETIQGQIGLNLSTAHFDYAWLSDQATATFNTDVTQALRSEAMQAHSGVQIRFTSTQDLRLTYDLFVTYAHTAADINDTVFNALSVRRLEPPQQLLIEHFFGGVGNLEAPSGAYSLQGEIVLPAGAVYRLAYNFTSRTDSDAVGVLDASGHLNVTINPVPSPSTLAMLLPLIACWLRRSPRTRRIPR